MNGVPMSVNWKLIVISSVLLFACDGYFGKKTSLDFIEKPEFQAREVAYVPILPFWQGVEEPSDVCAGFDELFYVVDAAKEEVICFDEAGNVLGRKQVQGASTVVQDRKFDLMVCGTINRDINGVMYELPCIYRLNLQSGNSYGLNDATVTSEVVHPFYYTANFSLSDADVRFGKIAVLADNSYYISRIGPDKNPNKLGGPDDAVLLFNAQDQFVTPIAVSTSGGCYRDFFKRPSGMASFVQPPQVTATNSRNFIYTSLSDDNALKVQIIDFIETDFGSSYEPRVLITGDTTQANDFLATPYRFDQPVSVSLSGDGTNFIFVADRMKDSVYLFTVSGLEGVKPPPGSTEKKYINVSFGGRGQGLMQFHEPSAVAYRRNILYVADRMNGRICRYKLTTDFR
jgi:hypothetical protein